MAEEVLWVTQEEYDAEVQQLAALRVEEDNLWRVLRNHVQNVRRWERRVPVLEQRFEELKARLPGSWREYNKVKLSTLPNARRRREFWDEERNRSVKRVIANREERWVEADRISRKRIRPIYRVVDYVKWFEMSIRKPGYPSFEVRGIFTIPGRLSPTDPAVIRVVEDKLKAAFDEWTRFRRIFVSDITKAGLEMKARTTGEVPPRFETRAEGGWWKVTPANFPRGLFGQREMPKPTYGEEQIGVSREFSRGVDVRIAKYVEDEEVKAWAASTVVSEDEFE